MKAILKYAVCFQHEGAQDFISWCEHFYSPGCTLGLWPHNFKEGLCCSVVDRSKVHSKTPISQRFRVIFVKLKLETLCPNETWKEVEP